MGENTKQIMGQTNCLMVISKTSLKNVKYILSLAKQMEQYSTETKLLAVVGNDPLVDEKQFLNTSVTTLIFQMEAGGSRLSGMI